MQALELPKKKKRRWLRGLSLVALGLVGGGGLWFSVGWRTWPQVEVFETPSSAALPSPTFRQVFGLRVPSEPKNLIAAPVVTLADRPALSPRKDRRDYVSISIYWWPNPLTGLPWLPRDGAKNPVTAHYDPALLLGMVQAVTTLTAAAQPVADERAVAWLRAWFRTPETRMNPHLTFAQMMPGIAAGGRQGIIEGLPLVTRLLDAIAVLEQRGALDAEDRRALRQWMESYLTWLCHSDPGRRERGRENNHGTWYDVQVAAIACALGDDEQLATTLARARERLGAQVLSDGRQPEELRRADGIAYSLYNLDAWLHLAVLEQRSEARWITDPTTGGKHLEAAISYLENTVPTQKMAAVRAIRARWKALQIEKNGESLR